MGRDECGLSLGVVVGLLRRLELVVVRPVTVSTVVDGRSGEVMGRAPVTGVRKGEVGRCRGPSGRLGQTLSQGRARQLEMTCRRSRCRGPE